jgi:hypothetical protein
MIALLLAAQLVGAASADVTRDMPADIVSTRSAPSRVLVIPKHALATVCPAVGVELAAANAARGATPTQVQTLNKLPKANYEIAVDRQIGGCVAPVVVSYQVGK